MQDTDWSPRQDARITEAMIALFPDDLLARIEPLQGQLVEDVPLQPSSASNSAKRDGIDWLWRAMDRGLLSTRLVARTLSMDVYLMMDAFIVAGYTDERWI